MSQPIDEIALAKSELGKKVLYDFHYNPKKLLAVNRAPRRVGIGIQGQLPFFGHDLWNHYEVSWLNEKGKPMVGIATLFYGCESPNLIESKSMKLYFNSFNNTPFKNAEMVETTIKNDLTEKVGASVEVKVTLVQIFSEEKVVRGFDGKNIDELDIACTVYTVDPLLLKIENEMVEETLCSDLLKSNCLVTGQPDWGSIQITYQGKKINHESLLRYIVSFRDHTEFGEHCIERIFMDILNHCKPNELTICISYTRRGGIDINFVRSTKPVKQMKSDRLSRQ